MAENPITNKDFYSGDGNPFKSVIDNLIELEKRGEETIATMIKLGNQLKQAGMPGNATELKQQAKLMEDIANAEKELANIEKQRAATERVLAQATEERLKTKKQLVKNENEQLKIEIELQKQQKLRAKTQQDINTEVKEGVKNLGEMRKELRQLRNISFEGKTKEEVKALKMQMGELMDQIADTRSEMQMMGTENAAVVVGGLRLISAGVEGVIGSLSVMGVENETVANLEKKMIALIATTQALAEIEDALTSGKARAIALRIQDMALTVKDNVVKRVSAVVSAAAGRAEAARATMTTTASVATKSAAAATWVFNVALKALMGPVGWIIAGVGALGTGIAYLTGAFDDNNEKSEIAISNAEALAAAYDKVVENIDRTIQIMDAQGATELEQAKKKNSLLTAEYNKYVINYNKARDAFIKAGKVKGDISNAAEVSARKIAAEEEMNIQWRHLQRIKKDREDAAFSLQLAILRDNKTKVDAEKKKNEELAVERKRAYDQRKKEFEDQKKEDKENFYDLEVTVYKATLDQKLTLDKENKDQLNLQEIQFQSDLATVKETAEEKEKRMRRDAVKLHQEMWAERLESTKKYAAGAIDALDTVSRFNEARMNKELTEAGDNESQKEAIRKKYAKREQNLAIGKATINGALAVGNALLTQPFVPAGLIFAALAAAKTASEIAVIKSVKYAKGGHWVEGGRLHSQGGNRYGDKELEKGEAVGVLSRTATKKYGKDFASVVDMFNAERPEIAMPDINIQPANFSEFNKLVQINRMLLNEQKALNGYFKTQLKQVAPGVFVDGQGNKMVQI